MRCFIGLLNPGKWLGINSDNSEGKSEVEDDLPHCKKCGRLLEIGYKFCPKCGADVNNPDEILRCGKCGTAIERDYKFCPKCGEDVNK